MKNYPGQTTITGVVACGGESSRMGRDKSFLNYHGKEQMFFVYDLLRYFCDEVFISRKQNTPITDSYYKYIFDKNEYSGHGPVSGLLSAAEINPGKSILYIGCDYPFITPKTIRKLIENNYPDAEVICYRNPKTNFSEPLLAIYKSHALSELKNRFASGQDSLLRFLETVNTKFVFPENEIEIKSIDTPEEFNSATNFLNSKSININN